ncbi:DUF6838 family protein [Paenibacillus sp. GCM10027626]|uniref:phage tail terminator family protein n=1 Tax=Paenibacillus sp. GCM10027626 TaxID=3273411 RepID=UPI0036315012
MEDLQNAIIGRLTQAYPDYQVYDDDHVPAEMERPCFVVTELHSKQTRGVDRRYIRTVLYDIQYFPASPASKQECRSMAEWLYEHLLFVGQEGVQFRTLDMSAEIKEGILHFSAGFSVHLILGQSQYPVMETMNEEARLK